MPCINFRRLPKLGKCHAELFRPCPTWANAMQNFFALAQVGQTSCRTFLLLPKLGKYPADFFGACPSWARLCINISTFSQVGQGFALTFLHLPNLGKHYKKGILSIREAGNAPEKWSDLYMDLFGGLSFWVSRFLFFENYLAKRRLSLGGVLFPLPLFVHLFRDVCGAYAFAPYSLTDDFFVPVSLFLSFLPENLLETTSPAGRL